MKMTKLQKGLYISVVATVLLLPVLVLAELPAPTVPGSIGGTAIKLQEVQDKITEIARFLIIVAIVLAVIFIVWGGVAYMMAGGNEEKATAATTRIKNGIIGAAVVLGVGVILQTLAGLITRSFFNT